MWLVIGYARLANPELAYTYGTIMIDIPIGASLS